MNTRKFESSKTRAWGTMINALDSAEDPEAQAQAVSAIIGWCILHNEYVPVSVLNMADDLGLYYAPEVRFDTFLTGRDLGD